MIDYNRYLSYIPHGINEDYYFPIEEDDEEFLKFKNDHIQRTNAEFTVFWSNRNIRRKRPSDVILAYKMFCDMLPKDKADKCVLILHTDPIDNNGTDLPAVIEALCPDYKVAFSPKKVDTKTMNRLYNISDVTLNISFAEGWGLSSHESMMAGTMIIGNVTGGLQDQMGFRDENDVLIDESYYNSDWMTNADGKYTTHGEWVLPVYPKIRTMVGSPPTPYIYEDYCSTNDVADALKKVYDMGKEERDRRGRLAREYCLDVRTGMTSKNMCNRMIKCIDTLHSDFVGYMADVDTFSFENVKIDQFKNKSSKIVYDQSK